MKDKSVKLPHLYPGQTTLQANSAGQIQFQVASNFKFYMTHFTYRSQVNNVNSIPTFDIQILKNEIGIFNDFAPNDVFPGRMVEVSTAPDTIYQVGLLEWYKFSVPYLFNPKDNIIVNLRDTCGQINTVRIILAGVKKYETPNVQ